MNKKKGAGTILKRLFSYVLRYYKLQCLSVLFLIIVSTMASVAGTLFMKNLIDDYILPFIGSSNPRGERDIL